MSYVLSVPETLDDRGFEALLAGMAAAENKRLLVDARRLRFVSPYGVLGLLAVGSASERRSGARPLLQPPDNREVLSYLSRIDFFENAHEVFDFDGRISKRAAAESTRLLEITAIRSHQDVLEVVDRVQDRASTILVKELNYPPTAVLPFSVILSELCQNIVEHAEAHGWVSAQRYNWKGRRVGKMVVVIAVMDVGMGFSGSLARAHAQQFGDLWSDAKALEQAFLHGVSRYPDPGRGQGLQGIRKVAMRWKGQVTIRSGTAKISEVPDWSDEPPIVTGLPDFPGAQIQIVLPEYTGAGDSRQGGRGDG